jgi:hypothetical protein
LPHRSCGFGSPEDAALIFVTFYQEKVKKNKPAGVLEKIKL